MQATIVLLPGDGIGPEVVHEGQRALASIAAAFGHELHFETHLIGGAAIDAVGDPLPAPTLAACQRADAILLGAVGGPRWDPPRCNVRPERGLLELRKALGLFANLRPVRVHPSLAAISPLKPERVAGVDILFIRELIGGLYFGWPRYRENTGDRQRAVDTLEYTDHEIRRVVELAFQLARSRRGRVTSVDKANVLASSALWREVASEVALRFPDVQLEHQLVDSCAMRLVSAASTFDVVVTENMFGDILTDEAAVLAGSLGLLPSAALGSGRRGLYEPIHGSAPELAGRQVANPIGTILSAALLLRYSLDLPAEATALEDAVDAAIADGARTLDTAGPGEACLSTAELGTAVCQRIAPPRLASADPAEAARGAGSDRRPNARSADDLAKRIAR